MGAKGLKNWVAFQLSKYKLKQHFNKTSVEDIIEVTRDFVGYGVYDRISMSQKKVEIESLAKWVRALEPQIVVEIGTRKGGTLFTWCRCTNASLIISIDLPGGIHGGGYPAMKQRFYKQFTADDPTRNVILIQDDSHALSTRDKLQFILQGRSIDFLFIDGDHTYLGVKNDFEMYAPLVRKGGLIAFHDIVKNRTENPDAATIEVPQYWDEIKVLFEHKEFLASKDQASMGIGVLVK